jgi:adenylosuccinate lyase
MNVTKWNSQGNEMKKIFTPRERVSTRRKLWLWLAGAEKELDVEQISSEAIEAIRANLVTSDEAFLVAADEEWRCRHDVMAHIHALKKNAPAAARVIHIAATSCFCGHHFYMLPNILPD